MPEIPFYWVDSFTSKSFGGGATTVCILEEPVEDKILSKIAQETGVLESAFVMKTGENEYDLRWFLSSGNEASTASYATLATTHVLVSEHGAKSPLRFNTKTGQSIAEINGAKITVFIPFLTDFEIIDYHKIAELLGVDSYVEMLYNDDFNAYCVVLENQKQVSDLNPDQCKIEECLNSVGGRFVVATSRGDEGYDFAYRVFFRTREDYACGSAQTALAPYWSEKLGKNRLVSIQPHSRVSILESEPLENGVKITSTARILVKGTMNL